MMPYRSEMPMVKRVVKGVFKVVCAIGLTFAAPVFFVLEWLDEDDTTAGKAVSTLVQVYYRITDS